MAERAQIIEESEYQSDGEFRRTVTVKTSRGDEFIIDLDAAAKSLADLFSALDNERRMGWRIEAEWYAHGLKKLRKEALLANAETATGGME